MPPRFSSLLDLKSVSPEQIDFIFSFASSLKEKPRTPRAKGETVALAFFEPSTRTRLSFQSAAIRAGLGPLVFEGGKGTSLEKGETVQDSLLNIAAMMPSAVIVRCGDTTDLAQVSGQISAPVINAGWGVKGHPTQALLDLFTLKEKWHYLSGKKLLIVGDLKHSRVAFSHVEVFEKLGMKIGQCGPQGFTLENSQVQSFSSLQEGLEWADAVMALRFQFERHDQNIAFSKEDYRALFGLNSRSLKPLRPDALILHPGPVHHGIEMETEVMADPRNIVLEQVQHGVYVREALLRITLGESL